MVDYGYDQRPELHTWTDTSSLSSNTGSTDWVSKNDPMRWAKDYIVRATNKKNKIPLLYRELLKFLISKLGSLAYIDSENNIRDIKCIHANPERTIAKLTQENNIILPIVSINQTTSDEDAERRRPDNLIVMDKVWDDSQHRALRVVSLVPKAITVSYGINVWTKYKADNDQVAEQIRLMFNPSTTLQAGTRDAGIAFLSGESDSSTLSPGDKEERVIKKTFEIKVQTYIPNPKFLITSTGQIEEFKTEFKLS
jgi:hypothetical protein